MNRYDIIEGHHAFYSDYYDGMGSEFHKRLSKIYTYYKPGTRSGYDSLTDEARLVYDNLKKKLIKP